MRISIRGSDRGYAVIFALVLITVFTMIFAAFVSRVHAMQKFSAGNRIKVIHAIEQSNREIINRYDLH